MKTTLLAAALGIAAISPALAEPVKYTLDASHSQIVFSYVHQGYSTTYGMFSGFDGEIMFDAADPAASSVMVAFPITTMNTGWEKRDGHLQSADFFGGKAPEVKFVSTGIELTGETTGKITGDLTIAGMTKPVVLDAVLNKTGTHFRSGNPFIGFSATTSLMRSEFGVGGLVPHVGDEVTIMISLEAEAKG